VAVRFASNTDTFGSHYCITHCHDTSVTVQGVTEEPPEPVYQVKEIFEQKIRPLRPFRGDIVMLNGASFFCTVQKGRPTVFNASLYDINNAMEAKDLKKHPLEGTGPEQHHEFYPTFNKIQPDRLPPHRPGIDHEARLKDGVTPTWGPLYSLSTAELVVLNEWLEENRSKGFIRQLSSLFAAPVLFAKKTGGGLQFCIDY